MIREDLIIDCIEGKGDWELLTWDELDLLQERIDNYISSAKKDMIASIVHHSSPTLQ